MALKTGKINTDKQKEQIANDVKGGNTFYKPKDGQNPIRIMPPREGCDYVFFKTATHWGIGPNQKNFNAPIDDDGRVSGWLANKAYALSKSKDQDDKELSEKIRAKKQWLYNVVDMNNIEGGIQIATFGQKIHEQLCQYFDNAADPDGYGDITDLDDGYVVVITKTGTNFKTKYDVRAKKNPSACPEEILALEDMPDLSKVRPIATDEEMKAAFEAGQQFDGEDEEEDETPVRRRAAAVEEVEEADELPFDEEDEEAAPAAAPARNIGSAVRSRRAVAAR